MKFNLIVLALILAAVLAACGGAPDPTLTSTTHPVVTRGMPRSTTPPTPMVTPVSPSPVPEVSGACSSVELSTVPELLRSYARGVACIKADLRQGTGFVVRNTDSGDGYLLTNAHVVGGDPAGVSVQLDNVAYSAEVVQTSVERDLAMVRICCGDFVVLKRNNREPHFGEAVMSLGFSDGELTYSGGVLRTVGYDSLNTYLEHTADVQPGGSGGPLLAFPFEAVSRAIEGNGWELKEGESLGVLGVTVGKSSEYDFTTYTIHQIDLSQFVTSVWSTLGFEIKGLSTTPEFIMDW